MCVILMTDWYWTCVLIVECVTLFWCVWWLADRSWSNTSVSTNVRPEFSSLQESPQFQSTITNVRTDLKHLSMPEVHEWVQQHVWPVNVVLLNCMGNLNIGMMIRTAMAYNCRRIFIVGKRKFDHRTCVGMHKYAHIEKYSELTHDFFQKRNMYPVWIEQCGKDLHRHNAKTMWQQHYPQEPCLVMGSERDGIPMEWIRSSSEPSYHLSISHPGIVQSLNVSVAFGMVLNRFYEQIVRT